MELSVAEAKAMIHEIFSAYGVAPQNTRILTELILKAEQEGSRSHGLLRVPDYVASLSSGWLNGAAIPAVTRETETALCVDCGNGFTQLAAFAHRDALMARARRHGMAALAVRNGHHIGALWCDVEPFAEAGFVALNFVNSRCRLAPYGSGRKLLGTNAMAFSCPDGAGGCITWDQASSTMSLGEIKLFALRGEPLPADVGLDAEGRPTRDPAAVLKGGAVLPFGGHKGSSIALMVEVMAAALTGANFGFQDDSHAFASAASSNAGQFVIIIDPANTTEADVSQRLVELSRHLTRDDTMRLPGSRRNALRQQGRPDTLSLSEGEHRLLNDCLAAARARGGSAS
jgi:delta1-piperideine-2-carboxylate reductase